MTAHQTKSIRTSWKAIEKIDAVTVGNLFYSRLFETNPELRALFRSPLPEQSRKLISMIGFVIARLDRLEDILSEVQKLAQRHVRYGVEEKHYAMVGTALLWTLEKGLGEQWTDELAAAWSDCYELLSSAMIDASYEPALS